MKQEANLTAKTRKLVVTAMMVAIMEILVWTPIGMIIIPPISATTAHTPVIIAALLEGPIAGIFVGLAFGVTTILQAATSPNFLDVLFLNPLVSVLPRVLIPITTYYSYIFFKKVMDGLFSKGNIVSCFLSGCIGSMTNTIGCMGMIYIIYAKRVVDELGVPAGKFIAGIIGVYGTMEMIVVAIIVAAITPMIKKKFYKKV